MVVTIHIQRSLRTQIRYRQFKSITYFVLSLMLKSHPTSSRHCELCLSHNPQTPFSDTLYTPSPIPRLTATMLIFPLTFSATHYVDLLAFTHLTASPLSRFESPHVFSLSQLTPSINFIWPYMRAIAISVLLHLSNYRFIHYTHTLPQLHFTLIGISDRSDALQWNLIKTSKKYDLQYVFLRIGDSLIRRP